MKSFRWLLQEAQADAEKTWPGCFVSVELLQYSDDTPGFRMTVSRKIADKPDMMQVLYGGQKSKSPSQAILTTRGDSIYALVKRMAEQKPDKSRMPQKILGTPEASLPALLCKSGIFRSHSEARTAIANGYISINFERETDPKRIIGQEDMNSDGSVLLSRGKRDTTTIFFDKDE